MRSDEEALATPGAVFLGWGAVALASAVMIAAVAPWPTRGAWVRLAHHYYDAGHLAGLGLCSVGAVLGWQRLASRLPAPRVRGPLGVAAAASVAGWWLLEEDLDGLAVKIAGDDATLWPWLLALVVAAGVALGAAVLVGRLLARPRWRWLPVGVALAATALNHLVFPRAYPGLHLWLACGAALFAGAALVGVRWPGRLARLRRPRVTAAAWAALAAIALPTFLVWPRGVVAFELAKAPGTALAPFLARAHFADVRGRPLRGPDRVWFQPREAAAAVPPSAPPLVARDAIVILVSMDAVRADLLGNPRHAGRFPALEALRAESVRFGEARATGSQTVYTLATLFAGKHFSQIYWSKKREAKGEQYWPRDDQTVRFPALLAAAGVHTATWSGMWWLVNSVGVVRGFAEEKRIKSSWPSKDGFALAGELTEPLIAHLRARPGGPQFLFVHYLDPHYPYDRGGRKVKVFERYLDEIGLIDAQVGRLVAMLKETGLWERTTILVMSDHGEAFGEHKTRHHATTMYEELVRVPLFIRVPGVAPRDVAEPVSTIDLGPTILDLLGAPTPGFHMGQSLVPFLRGEDPALARPMVGEGYRKQMLVTRAGIKAIRDLAAGTIEAYDLERDPKEKRNIAGEPEAEDAINRLRLFFDVHTLQRPGYVVPYRG